MMNVIVPLIYTSCWTVYFFGDSMYSLVFVTHRYYGGYFNLLESEIVFPFTGINFKTFIGTK